MRYNSRSVKVLGIDGKRNIILYFELMSTQLTECCAFTLYFVFFGVEEERERQSSLHFPFFMVCLYSLRYSFPTIGSNKIQ